jgi:hypothetical protein
MDFNTNQLKAEVAKLASETGESYVSLKLEINAQTGLKVPALVEWSCYSPRVGHTRRYDTPAEALADTLKACSDPGKILQAAEALEAEARLLRLRIKEGGAQ